MPNYAKDLHKQGRHGHIKMMENKANTLVRGTKGGLGHAFLTTAYLGSDCFAIIANSAEYENKTGYVLWDEDLGRAVFVKDDEE